MLLPNQKKNISQIVLSIAIEIMLTAKLERLTKQKLFPSCKLKLEEKSTRGANEMRPAKVT